MKYVATIAITLLLASGPVVAEEAPTTTKGPPVTMGDEGKLPATSTVTNKVPEMGATEAPAATGGTKRMGDEGTLPATGTMSGATPQMTPDASK